MWSWISKAFELYAYLWLDLLFSTGSVARIPFILPVEQNFWKPRLLISVLEIQNVLVRITFIHYIRISC